MVVKNRSHHLHMEIQQIYTYHQKTDMIRKQLHFFQNLIHQNLHENTMYKSAVRVGQHIFEAVLHLDKYL
eukprot:351253-Prymnesium_polylepis.1